MGSVGSECEDESHPDPSTKCKSWEKTLEDCGAVNNALVPRKPRSAIKKTARENIVLPWSISRKKRRVSNGIGKPRVKKSGSIMKKGEISKDEEEVVETLNSLAQMFSNTPNTNKPEIDDELSIIKSPTQDSMILNEQEEPEKINTSNHTLVVVESFESSRERSMVALDQAENQYDKFRYTKVDKCKGILTSPTLSSTRAIPTWSENTSSVVQRNYIGDKYPRVVVEPKKRCSTHVRIARLIKAVQKPVTLQGLTPRPTQLTISRGVGQRWREQPPLPLKVGPSLEALKQYHASYQQLRAHPNIHGRTSAEVALQARLSNSMLQQRWPAATPHLRDWQTRGRLDSTSFFNEAQPRFPYMHSPLIGPKFQTPPPQPWYMPFANSSSSLSNTERRLAYERNGGLYSNNMQLRTPLRWTNT